MLKFLVLGAAVFITCGPAQADQQFKSRLAGHSVLPAASFFAPPADAPDLFKMSGKFTAPDRRRVETIGANEATSFLSAKEAPRKTGMTVPFGGQPYQGFSGIKSNGDGSFWALLDNGFGAKANSADAMLSLHLVRPDWQAGRTSIERSIFLSDPDRKIPFQIMLEGSEKRYLTGADLDIESLQSAGNSFWIGDEFGPYLLEVDTTGKVLAVFETEVSGKIAKSPDHYSMSTPANPGDDVAFNVRRSRGYEGMAASKDGKFLYPMLEGPLWDEAAKNWEALDGKEYLRILEFDVAARRWTGRHWKYVLEASGNNIGDFNMIDATTGLVVERDNGEGDAAQACPPDKIAADCFNTPAKFKRVNKIEMSAANAGAPVRKIGHLDLLSIDDPERRAIQGGKDGMFSFPFVTIENVDAVDASHLVVGNDNNLPYSSGRALGKQDDNELILLEAKEFLAAK